METRSAGVSVGAAAGAAGAGGIGVHHHAIPHLVVAGGDHGMFALHLHTAHPAGGDFVDAL